MFNILSQLGIIKSVGLIKGNNFSQWNYLPFSLKGKNFSFRKLKFINNKIFKNSSMPVIIPGDKLVLKIFYNIPVSNKKNLDNIIYYKIQSDVIPALQKLNYFYTILDKNNQSKECTIAVLFYNENDLNKFKEVTEKENIHIESFIFDIAGFIEYLKKLKTNKADKAELLIQSFGSYHYAGIKKENSIHYVRIINTSPSGLKKEISDTIQYYKKLNPDEDIETITMLNCDTKPDQLNQILIKHTSLNENDLLSLVLKKSIPKIFLNLTKTEILFKGILNTAFKISIFILLLLLTGIFINTCIQNKTKFFQKQIKNLEKSLKIIKPLQNKEEKYNKFQAVKNKILPQQSILSTYLQELSMSVPEMIRFKNLSYENKFSKIVIEGYAEDMGIINTLIGKLNLKFKKAELVSTEQENFGEKKLINFIIKFEHL